MVLFSVVFRTCSFLHLTRARMASKRKRELDGTASMHVDHYNANALKSYAETFRSGTPFPHLHVHNIVPDELLQRVRKELLSSKQVYYKKKNDLYDFQQTDSLRLATSGSLKELRDLLYGDTFRAWMTSVTGIETTAQVDISAAQYVKGSHLLCHDDDLSTRRIAFILYLVPEAWSTADGGTLDLYNSLPDYPAVGGGVTPAPHRVVRRITPAWNSLAFFEVNPTSFHAVAEVMDDSKGPRLSISGWFHGSPIPRPPLPMPSRPQYLAPRPVAQQSADSAGAGKACLATVLSTSSTLSDWINSSYLSPSTRASMRAQFQGQGSLSLPSFLRPEVYMTVMKALGVQAWKRVGPPHMTNHAIAASTTPHACPEQGYALDPAQALFAFMTSAPFLAYLASITGLHAQAVAGALRAFTAGDYTLVSDPEYKEKASSDKAVSKGLPVVPKSSSSSSTPNGGGTQSADEVQAQLEATLCLTVGSEDDWPEHVGGYMSYLSSDEELLSVPPCSNSLSLVATGPGVMSFTKYITGEAGENRYDVHLQVA